MEDLKNEPTFHWSMDLEGAKRRFREHGQNRCYLTRYCKEHNELILSVMDEGKPAFQNYQFTVKKKENISALKGKKRSFPQSQKCWSTIRLTHLIADSVTLEIQFYTKCVKVYLLSLL